MRRSRAPYEVFTADVMQARKSLCIISGLKQIVSFKGKRSCRGPNGGAALVLTQSNLLKVSLPKVLITALETLKADVDEDPKVKPAIEDKKTEEVAVPPGDFSQPLAIFRKMPSNQSVPRHFLQLGPRVALGRVGRL